MCTFWDDMNLLHFFKNVNNKLVFLTWLTFMYLVLRFKSHFMLNNFVSIQLHYSLGNFYPFLDGYFGTIKPRFSLIIFAFYCCIFVGVNLVGPIQMTQFKFCSNMITLEDFLRLFIFVYKKTLTNLGWLVVLRGMEI